MSRPHTLLLVLVVAFCLQPILSSTAHAEDEVDVCIVQADAAEKKGGDNTEVWKKCWEDSQMTMAVFYWCTNAIKHGTDAQQQEACKAAHAQKKFMRLDRGKELERLIKVDPRTKKLTILKPKHKKAKHHHKKAKHH